MWSPPSHCVQSLLRVCTSTRSYTSFLFSNNSTLYSLCLIWSILWWLILCVNLNRPWGAQILVTRHFLMGVRVFLDNINKSLDLKQIAVPSVLTSSRALKAWTEFALSSWLLSKLGHWSLSTDCTIGCHGSSVCLDSITGWAISYSLCLWLLLSLSLSLSHTHTHTHTDIKQMPWQ
jgi:hypothetical protein